MPLSIRTPLDKLPLSLSASRDLIVERACEPTESCLFLCLSISSRTFNGMTISLFPNEFIQLESVKYTLVSRTYVFLAKIYPFLFYDNTIN